MPYDADKVVVTPADQIIEAMIVAQSDKSVGDFIQGDEIHKKWRDLNQKAVNFTMEGKYGESMVHADWMIPYREEPITKGALRNKHFEAFKNKYGSFPKIGVKVKRE